MDITDEMYGIYQKYMKKLQQKRKHETNENRDINSFKSSIEYDSNLFERNKTAKYLYREIEQLEQDISLIDARRLVSNDTYDDAKSIKKELMHKKKQYAK
jgi:hypothetical protein